MSLIQSAPDRTQATADDTISIIPISCEEVNLGAQNPPRHYPGLKATAVNTAHAEWHLSLQQGSIVSIQAVPELMLFLTPA